MTKFALPLLFALTACSGAPFVYDAQTSDCTIGSAGEPTELRCTGLYSDWSSRILNPDVKPFALGIPLWSDGAEKSRYVLLPPNTTINTSDMNEWNFPVGTKFWKQFVVQGELIETRLLWKQPTGWYRTTYRWSKDLSSTQELTTGELNANNLGYEVPSQGECNECHNGQKDGILGFSAVSLSNPGSMGLNMNALLKDGLLSSPPVKPIEVPGSALDQSALGFLHINCGMVCHNESSGYSSFTGFWMRLDTNSMNNVQDTNTWKTGVGQSTLFFSRASERIAPGNPGGSCVHVRMSHRNDDEQMPPIDSHKIDDAAVQMIDSWINSLPTTP